MSARAVFIAVRNNLEELTLHSAAAASALWMGVVIREWPKLSTFGAICGDTGAFLGHCPLCYPAAALTGLALAGAFALSRRRIA